LGIARPEDFDAWWPQKDTNLVLRNECKKLDMEMKEKGGR